MTESFTLMFIWTFHKRNTGKLANVQSVNIDTAATANDNAVCISRGWQDPGVSVYQFFLISSLVGRSLTTRKDLHVYLLDRKALKEQVHARTTHSNQTKHHVRVDNYFDPEITIGDSSDG